MKHMKKVFNTNGSIVTDEEMGDIIQLQGARPAPARNAERARARRSPPSPPTPTSPGDQRFNVKDWLTAQEIVTVGEVDRIVIHGAY